MYTVLCKGKHDDKFRLYRNCDTRAFAIRLSRDLNNRGIDSIVEHNFYVRQEEYEKDAYRWK